MLTFELRQVVYRSEHVISNLNPNFKPFTLDLRRVYEGDLHKKVRFLLYDWQKSGKHRPLGALETTLAELLDATPHDNFPVIFKRGHKRKEVGCIHVKGATVHGHGPTLNRDNSQSSVDTSHYTSSSEDGSDEENTDTTYNPKLFVPEVPDRPTFVDYLSGGCEINTIVAIDFAGSNGMCTYIFEHLSCPVHFSLMFFSFFGHYCTVFHQTQATRVCQGRYTISVGKGLSTNMKRRSLQFLVFWNSMTPVNVSRCGVSLVNSMELSNNVFNADQKQKQLA